MADVFKRAPLGYGREEDLQLRAQWEITQEGCYCVDISCWKNQQMLCFDAVFPAGLRLGADVCVSLKIKSKKFGYLPT